VRQLDLRQAPAEVEYAFQLVYDAGDRAPDAVLNTLEIVLLIPFTILETVLFIALKPLLMPDFMVYSHS
jgi:hypothetical protein